ncbi:hypothetical protein NUW58_g7593 [Xylaria curta]|uniref:Uncharacterized protein n=1 Tax=Xylaria curta TaxID=42375 RepID=A0ACC1NFR6_9PEZI|nr:hypothetical protein NUW58_g7593 [Xylaria curta]
MYNNNTSEAPTYPNFSFENDDNLEFGMFDVHPTSNDPRFQQGMRSELYPNIFPPQVETSPLVPIFSPDPRLSMPQYVLAPQDERRRASTSYLPHTDLDPSVCSTGSSSGPGTTGPQRLHVPKGISVARHSIESQGGLEPLVHEPYPVSGPGRRKPGKNRRKEDVGLKEKEGRRRHFLQRNRVAAMKCRRKKKEWVNDLEGTKSELETRNSRLHMELDQLSTQASHIRAQLMAHANCHDSNINKWIENEAKRFVIGTGERYDQILASSYSPSQPQGIGEPTGGRAVVGSTAISGHHTGLNQSAGERTPYAPHQPRFGLSYILYTNGWIVDGPFYRL